MSDFSRRKRLSICWFNKASDLHGAAAAIWFSMDDTRSKEIVEELGLDPAYRMSAAVRSVYSMLCGMSLELLLKAIIVDEGSEPRSTHNLNHLLKDAGISLSTQEQDLLAILSGAIIWDGRYPVPKTESHLTRLDSLKGEHLFDKEPIGPLEALSPNEALGWGSYLGLWRSIVSHYHHGP
jgi:hypothetical protein